MLLIPLNRGGNPERKPDQPLDPFQFASGPKLGLEERCHSPQAPQEVHIRGKRDTASLSDGEQVLPRPAASCTAGKQPRQPQGASALQASHLPTALQSLQDLILVQTFVPARPRKMTLWQLQTAPSLPMFPLLPGSCSSHLLLKDHQTRLTLWHGPVCFTLPQVTEFSYLIHQWSSIH